MRLNIKKPIINIKLFDNRWRNYIGIFNKIARSCLKNRNYYIEILLVNDKIIKKVNSYYRGIDSPTDVLSFPVKNGFYKKRLYYGEVFLSFEYIWQKSNFCEKIFKKKIALILVHGILHLLGYDHEIDSDRVIMQGVESLILKSVGRNLESNNF